jgi:hypothetical protein
MRSDALNEGASYPAITVTVNVAANATTPQVNQVIVSGDGSAIAGATDPTTIVSIFGAAVTSFVGSDTSLCFTAGCCHFTAADNTQMIELGW